MNFRVCCSWLMFHFYLDIATDELLFVIVSGRVQLVVKFYVPLCACRSRNFL